MPTSTNAFGPLTSSVDPNALSLTVQGIIGIVSSLIVYEIAIHLHVSLSMQQVTDTVTEGAVSISSIVTLIGAIRKPVAAIGSAIAEGPL